LFPAQTLVEPEVDSIYRGGVGCESSRKALFIGDREVAAKQQKTCKVNLAEACRKPTTKLQPKPTAETKTVVSAKTFH
jgi:hypothetical protein